MIRKPLLALAAAGALLAGGLAVAKADNLLAFGQPRPALDEGASRDRLLARTAFTEVLAKRAETLAMKAPTNLAPYAPIYPDGLVLYAMLAPASESGGQVQYVAAAPLRATLDFYEDAAALHHLPFTVKADGPDALVFQAGDGRRSVQAKLTRQFENGTEVDLTYN
jgi:hypothetical protein